MRRFIPSLCACLLAGQSLADGTEALNPPSIDIAGGTGFVVAGTGLVNQPGEISIQIPPSALVRQVLLYWQGFTTTDTPGDDSVMVSADAGQTATAVTGTLIGGTTLFARNVYASTFRADVTSLELLQPGANVLQVSGMEFDFANNGAGILVILDDGRVLAGPDLRDGQDLAFINFAGDLQGTVPQTFVFETSDVERVAHLGMFIASVAGSVSGGGLRPTAIELTTDGPSGETLVLDNLLDSNDGQEWDTLSIALTIPAGTGSLTAQIFSRDDLGTGQLPASLAWVAAGFAFEPSNCGRITGGGSVFTDLGARVTRGFELHCDLRTPNNLEVSWPGHRFHLTSLSAALCADTATNQAPPKSSPFDTFKGAGNGLLNGEDGARIEFVMVDGGEPGNDDTLEMRVYDARNDLVLDVDGPVYRGNFQTHRDKRCQFP